MNLSDNNTKRHIYILSFFVFEEEVFHMEKSIEVRFIDLCCLPEVFVDIIFLLEKTIIIETSKSLHDFFSFRFVTDFENLQNNLGNTDDKIFASIFCEKWFHEMREYYDTRKAYHKLILLSKISPYISLKYRNKYYFST